jgi:hypothetical protein
LIYTPFHAIVLEASLCCEVIINAKALNSGMEMRLWGLYDWGRVMAVSRKDKEKEGGDRKAIDLEMCQFNLKH